MRKIPSEDRTLYDHIKELWTTWVLDEDPQLSQVTEFKDFLLGYFAHYYKGDSSPIESALDFFMGEIDVWEVEHDFFDKED